MLPSCWPSFSSLESAFLHKEFTFSSSCSRSDLSLVKMRLSPTLTLSPFMTKYFEQMALFHFSLAKTAPAYLPTALSVALRPLFPFQQAQYVQVFPLKPAPFCTLFAGFGSAIESATPLLFSYYLTFVLSSPLCPLLHLFFYLKLCGRSGRNCRLPSCSISLQWVLGHSFLPGKEGADELATRGTLLAPSAIPCVSLLSSLASTFLELEAYCLI